MFMLHFCLKMLFIDLYIFEHLFDYLIVYICLFALVSFQIMLISHYI